MRAYGRAPRGAAGCGGKFGPRVRPEEARVPQIGSNEVGVRFPEGARAPRFGSDKPDEACLDT